jgi:hypothetical protein
MTTVVTTDEQFTDATPSGEPADQGETPTDPVEPTYEDVVAERDQLRADLEAAGAGKLAAEAAKHRTRLREVESDLEEATEALASANAALYAIAAERAQVKPEWMAARGIEAAHYADGSGVVNIEELVAAMERERDELGMPRKPKPNPVAGRTTSTVGTPTGKAAWDAAFGVSR